ncbi:hypothetical protein N7539_003979 [Penicillium diatomitis]|uniref:PLAC8-domain-containing protein n=1 Tax=Penicillium diatomitis TaxID=2819901 RepID=A0A9X0BY28_9EURO|nr:uncharacterized protein N7539_003979 [Penicillium diatomitis]KAJ5489089.1 hypothetical protein N7539_003979 [Penicillium diatomitis]
MDRPLYLDTQFGQGQEQGNGPRYSFINTPRDMQGSDDLHPSMFTAPHAQAVHDSAIVEPALRMQHHQPSTTFPLQHAQHNQYRDCKETPQSTQHGSPVQYKSPETSTGYSDEKAHLRPYVQCPPVEQHPAFHIPPNSPDRQSQLSPLPPKYPHDEAPSHGIQRRATFPVEPDANPLQSPQAIYFPPPATPAVPSSQEPPMNDLGAFHHPGQSMHPIQEAHGGSWNHELCECSNVGTCCLGITCPCILYGRTQHRLAMKSRKQDPTNMLGYNLLNGSCTGMALLCGCQWLLATVQHARTRKAYGIEGDICTDCVRATCCTCCTLIQDEKEIQTREERRERAARERGATLSSPYSAPTSMIYPGPPAK